MTNNYDFNRQQNETKFQHLVRVSVDKLNKLHNKEWVDIKEEFNFEHSSDSLRKYATGWKLLAENGYLDETSDNNQSAESDNEPIIKYKESTEIMGDGSQKSDKLVSMSIEQSKDVNYLLNAHGFNTDEWELTSAKNNIWNTNSQSQGVQTLYSSKITVKPKNTGFNIDKVIERINKEVKPVHINSPLFADKKLLEIPLFDMHFGIATLDYYNETYSKIIDKIQSRKWDTILFVIGQDLLHNDGFTGKTTSGTIIDKVDMEQAIEDAKTFYYNLITEALKNSVNVNAIFSSGNHDQAVGYLFVQMLEVKFPQVQFDTKMKQRKGFVWNDLFLGFSHGDKGSNRLNKNFLSEFGKEIARAKIVEVHSGHIHHEVTKDDFGIVIRSLATGAKTDDYHYDNGFIGAMKRFQLFEYSMDSLDAIYYV